MVGKRSTGNRGKGENMGKYKFWQKL